MNEKQEGELILSIVGLRKTIIYSSLDDQPLPEMRKYKPGWNFDTVNSVIIHTELMYLTLNMALKELHAPTVRRYAG